MKNVIDFEKIPEINIDCCISFGRACRPAEALKRNNLRFFSSPFDWIMNYSLDIAISLLKNKGEKFFSHCYEYERYSSENNLGIIENDTFVISMHDFPKVLTITDAPKYFHYKYDYKFKYLDYILKNANTICLISNRQINTKTIKNFINEFLKLYSFKHVYYINIYDTCNKTEEQYKICNYNNVSILEFYFNDEHINGRTNNNLFWLGNVAYWDKILNKIKINNNFIRNMKIRKFLFHISYDCNSVSAHKIYTICGVKLKFKQVMWKEKTHFTS